MRRAGRRGNEDRGSHHSDAVQLLRRISTDGALRQENGRYLAAAAGSHRNEARPSLALSCDAALPVTGCIRMART